jgi:hypothetical protein
LSNPGSLLDITRGEVLAEQGDLVSLCRERPLETMELFPPNAYYGNDLALKLYCGWPWDRPLKVIVPHGVVFNREYLWESERQARLPVILVYPDYRMASYRSGTRKVVLPGTAPFVFICRMLRGSSQPRAGTLFFPAHSTHGVTAQTDHAAIADRLARLDGRFHPVRVCVYWRDFLAGRQQAYADRGFEIVSAGHMYDPRFMVRLYHLLAMHRFASSHTSGSYIFQAVHAGCSYFHLSGLAVELKADGPANLKDFCEPAEAQPAIAAFSEMRDEVTDEQRRVVESYFGSKNISSPPAMREILEIAERLDRFGVAHDSSRGGFHCMFPPGPMRVLRRAARRMLTWPSAHRP